MARTKQTKRMNGLYYETRKAAIGEEERKKKAQKKKKRESAQKETIIEQLKLRLAKERDLDEPPPTKRAKQTGYALFF